MTGADAARSPASHASPAPCPAATPPDAATRALLAAYALCSLLLIAVSARLWWQQPLDLIAHEFDYWLGAFDTADKALTEEHVAQGRLVHLAGFAVVGALYLALVLRLARRPETLGTRAIAGYAALIAFIYALGMPWLSPDVFFYIGTGWLESYFGMSPYRVTIASLPGFEHDAMFSNIFPGFVHGTTAYGPLFQKAAMALAALSFGHLKLALALHKLASLAWHGLASALVWRLAPPATRRLALLAYAANPLILFSVLTCAHNDAWMNAGVMLALLALAHGRWAWCGAALGAAFCIKYFPLVFLPVLLLAVVVRRGRDDGRWHWRHAGDAAGLLLGFVLVAVAAHAMYPESLPQFSRTATTGVSVYRNSIYHFVDLMSFFVLPALFDTQGVLFSYKELGQLARIAYIAAYPLVLLLFVRRMRRQLFEGAVEACLVVTLMYFVFVNTTNQEWYLTWLMGFAFVLPQAHARLLGWRLSVYFMPLVIYTVKSVPSIQLLANAALYLVVAVLALMYLARVAWPGRALHTA